MEKEIKIGYLEPSSQGPAESLARKYERVSLVPFYDVREGAELFSEKKIDSLVLPVSNYKEKEIMKILADGEKEVSSINFSFLVIYGNGSKPKQWPP